MTTVASRTFRSTPERDAHTTWTAIVDLLTQGRPGAARTELMAVAGVAASVIADAAPRDAAIVVICDGPRTRIYCIYDDDAIDVGVVVDAEDNTDYRVVNVDIVPAFAADDDYEIPDDDTGKWIKTNPEIHASKATAAHQSPSGNLMNR